MVGSPELVRAWLEGDFEIHEGSYFPEFSSRHIIQPFNIPKHWPRYLGYDWGFHSPFAAIWGAVSSGRDDKGNEVPYPKGAIIVYRELTGKGIDNVEQATRIGSLSVGENIIPAADPSIFNNQGGPTIADQFHGVFAKYGFPQFRRADNDRITGWSQIRQRLVAKPALLYITTSCPYLLETLPALVIDKRKPEDADSKGNDHACLTGDTLVITDSGPIAIKDLCGNFSVFVLSHNGYYQEACGALTRKAAKVITLSFDDDTQVTCTPDHRFMLADGTFKKACLLTYSDLIQCVTYESNGYFRHMPRVQRAQLLPLRQILQFAKEGYNWIKTIASNCLGILKRKDSKRNAYPPYRWQSLQQSIRELSNASDSGPFAWAHDPRKARLGKKELNCSRSSNGKVLAQVASGQGVAFGTCNSSSSGNANNRKDLRVLRGGLQDKTQYEKQKQVLTSKLQNVCSPKKVKSIVESETPQDVYCLNVPKTSTFILANGIVSHNCDALRYLCKERLIDSKWEQPPEVFNKGMIRLQSYIAKMRQQASAPKI
jgi:hypothetical protein